MWLFVTSQCQRYAKRAC